MWGAPEHSISHCSGALTCTLDINLFEMSSTNIEILFF